MPQAPWLLASSVQACHTHREGQAGQASWDAACQLIVVQVQTDAAALPTLNCHHALLKSAVRGRRSRDGPAAATGKIVRQLSRQQRGGGGRPGRGCLAATSGHEVARRRHAAQAAVDRPEHVLLQPQVMHFSSMVQSQVGRAGNDNAVATGHKMVQGAAGTSRGCKVPTQQFYTNAVRQMQVTGQTAAMRQDWLQQL